MFYGRERELYVNTHAVFGWVLDLWWVFCEKKPEVGVVHGWWCAMAIEWDAYHNEF